MTERLSSTLGASCKAGAGARSCPTSQKGRGATVWDEHGDLRPAVWPQVHGRGISRQRPCPSQAGGGEMKTRRRRCEVEAEKSLFSFNCSSIYTARRTGLQSCSLRSLH